MLVQAIGNLGVKLTLTYEDSEGRVTRRRVIANDVVTLDAVPYRLHAYCLKRSDDRTFLFARILEIETAEGELRDAYEWADQQISKSSP